MAWYFNFCSPALPNDPTINVNRKFQTGCLIAFMALYIVAHIYYKFFGPELLEEKQIRSESAGSDGSSDMEKGSDETSEQHDEKSISIAGGFGGHDDNSSYVTFNTKEDDHKKLKKSRKGKKKKQYEVFENVTVEEIQSYFPIVFGHYAIAMTFCIMYSPYTEQTIAGVVYIVLGVIATFANGKRKKKLMKIVWGIMCFIIFFLVMSSLLEVGQANFNKIQKKCFAVGYKPLY